MKIIWGLLWKLLNPFKVFIFCILLSVSHDFFKNCIVGDEMGHFVVAAIIGAIEPINKEIANTLAKMVKDQMFR